MLPLILASFLVTFGALVVCVPIGIGTALFLHELATDSQRALLKPMIEILAGIPSIVYGFFGMVVVAPFLQDPLGIPTGLMPSPPRLVLGIMATPTVASLAEDALSFVPQKLPGGVTGAGREPLADAHPGGRPGCRIGDLDRHHPGHEQGRGRDHDRSHGCRRCSRDPRIDIRPGTAHDIDHCGRDGRSRHGKPPLPCPVRHRPDPLSHHAHDQYRCRGHQQEIPTEAGARKMRMKAMSRTVPEGLNREWIDPEPGRRPSGARMSPSSSAFCSWPLCILFALFFLGTITLLHHFTGDARHLMGVHHRRARRAMTKGRGGSRHRGHLLPYPRCDAFALPLGLACAIYLCEYSPEPSW